MHSTMESSNQFTIMPPGGLLPPKGLSAAMEGLVREVLLKNPKDIFKFAAEYFEKLIDIRKRSSFDKDENIEINNLIYYQQNQSETKNNLNIEKSSNISLPIPDNITLEPLEQDDDDNDLCIKSSEGEMTKENANGRMSDDLQVDDITEMDIPESDLNADDPADITDDKISPMNEEQPDQNDIKNEDEEKTELTNENIASNLLISNTDDSDGVIAIDRSDDFIENEKIDSDINAEKLISLNAEEKDNFTNDVNDVENIQELSSSKIPSNEEISSEKHLTMELENAPESLESTHEDNRDENDKQTTEEIETLSSINQEDKINQQPEEESNLADKEVGESQHEELVVEAVIVENEVDPLNNNEIPLAVNEDDESIIDIKAVNESENEDLVNDTAIEASTDIKDESPIESVAEKSSADEININETTADVNKEQNDEDLLQSSAFNVEIEEKESTDIITDLNNEDTADNLQQVKSIEFDQETEKSASLDTAKTVEDSIILHDEPQSVTVSGDDDDIAEATLIENDEILTSAVQDSSIENIANESNNGEIETNAEVNNVDSVNAPKEDNEQATLEGIENIEIVESDQVAEVALAEENTENAQLESIENNESIESAQVASVKEDTENAVLYDSSNGEIKNDEYSLEKAAIIIQKIIRGFLIRRKISNLTNEKHIAASIEDTYDDDKDVDQTAEIIHANIEPALYTVLEEKNGSYSTEDESSTFSSAATKIQAGVRGFLTRKYFQRNRTNNSTDTTAPSIGEDSKSFDDIANPLDSQSADEAVSKIIVATSSIIIDQLEHFEMLENKPSLNSTSIMDSTDIVKDGEDMSMRARKKLKREDAIQLHSPYSSEETPTNKYSPGKTSEDDEPIGDLAQSIITEIISNSYTPMVEITQNDDTNEFSDEHLKDILIQNMDENLNIEENYSSSTKINAESDIDQDNAELTSSARISDDSDDKENSSAKEEDEHRKHIFLKYESVQSDDGDVIVGPIKIIKPLTDNDSEFTKDTDEADDENIAVQNEKIKSVSSEVKEDDQYTDIKQDSAVPLLEDNQDDVVVGNERLSKDTSNATEASNVLQHEDGVTSVNEADGVKTELSELNNGSSREETKSRVDGLMHTGEFHDTVVLPTKVTRMSSAASKGLYADNKKIFFSYSRC